MGEEGRVGSVTSTGAALSERVGCGVAIAMIDRDWWDGGTAVVVTTPEGELSAEVCGLPFVQPR